MRYIILFLRIRYSSLGITYNVPPKESGKHMAVPRLNRCSNDPAYGCIDFIYHVLGNTEHIIPVRLGLADTPIPVQRVRREQKNVLTKERCPQPTTYLVQIWTLKAHDSECRYSRLCGPCLPWRWWIGRHDADDATRLLVVVVSKGLPVPSTSID